MSWYPCRSLRSSPWGRKFLSPFFIAPLQHLLNELQHSAVGNLLSNQGQEDLAIEELRRRLAEKGLVFGEGTIRRFLDRHRIMRKKRQPTPANRSVRTS